MGLSLILASLCIFPMLHSSTLFVRASTPTYSASIVDYAYQPKVINITTGTEVIWTYVSSGRDRHTVSSTPQTNITQGGTPLISSGTLNPGQSFSYIFYKLRFYVVPRKPEKESSTCKFLPPSLGPRPTLHPEHVLR